MSFYNVRDSLRKELTICFLLTAERLEYFDKTVGINGFG